VLINIVLNKKTTLNFAIELFFIIIFGVFHECQVQGFFKISKVTKKLTLVKNA